MKFAIIDIEDNNKGIRLAGSAFELLFCLVLFKKIKNDETAPSAEMIPATAMFSCPVAVREGANFISVQSIFAVDCISFRVACLFRIARIWSIEEIVVPVDSDMRNLVAVVNLCLDGSCFACCCPSITSVYARMNIAIGNIVVLVSWHEPRRLSRLLMDAIVANMLDIASMSIGRLYLDLAIWIFPASDTRSV